MKKASLFLLVLCAALLLAACGGSKGGQTSPTQVTPKTNLPASSSDLAATSAPLPASSSDLEPAPETEPETEDEFGIGSGRVFASYLDEDVMPVYYDAFVADDGEYAVKIVYASNTIVTDVRVLSLAMTDYKDGKPVFDETELYRQEQLAPDCPLIVTLVFAGDLPTNGISYVDINGDTQRFALSQSGKDGSLILEAY